MALATRKTRMAVVQESTVGVLVAPSSGSDYLAVQDGLSLTPSFATLENAELKGSIGKSKTILGVEQPEGSISHYLYGSGTEGVAPEMDLMIKAAMGASSVASTEYDTVSSSTAGTASAPAVIKVNTGEGATFERGEALIIKDSMNGYSIRPIESISGDDLTLGFNLSAAPALGVNLGKAVLYKPADDGHPTLSVWDYRGNGAAVQAMAGTRVSEMAIEGTAGEFVNCNFSFAGTSFFFNPIEITSSSNKIDVTDDDGTFVATVASAFYSNPHELAAAIAQALNATASTEVYTVSYIDSNGKYLIKATGTLLSLLWNTGANTANSIAPKIGFSTAADDTGTAAATGYTSDTAIALESPQTPVLDAQDPLVAKSNDVFLGDFADNVCFHPRTVTATISNELVDVPSICADSGISEKVVSSREVSIEISATLDQFEADKFKRFKENEETRFMWAFGPKSGGNYAAGKSGCLYIPKATISSFELTDEDGVVALSMTVSAYTASGEGEVFLNFL